MGEKEKKQKFLITVDKKMRLRNTVYKYYILNEHSFFSFRLYDILV